MKFSIYCSLFAVTLVLTLGVTGCKKGVKGPTPIPTRRPGLTETDNTSPIDRTARTVPSEEGTRVQPIGNPDGTIPLGSRIGPDSEQDRVPLASYTVYFDFDRSAIRSGETGKIESVSSYLKSNAGVGVLIEGHCDERGTEQYNLSLGERRALAIREYLVNLGIDGNRVFTISFGEDRPADPGHNDAAWAKNRRGEFVVLKPKQ